jgi:hypothetical protein
MVRASIQVSRAISSDWNWRGAEIVRFVSGRGFSSNHTRAPSPKWRRHRSVFAEFNPVKWYVKSTCSGAWLMNQCGEEALADVYDVPVDIPYNAGPKEGIGV